MPATEFKVGDLVIMEWSALENRHGKREPLEMKISEAKRVWLTAVPSDPDYKGWVKELKFRRDTQDSGDRSFSQHNHHFYSPEQYAEIQLDRACNQILRDAKIEMDWRSSFHSNKEFKRALAGFVKKWQSEHPEN